jgi:hypothetical protein
MGFPEGDAETTLNTRQFHSAAQFEELGKLCYQGQAVAETPWDASSKGVASTTKAADAAGVTGRSRQRRKGRCQYRAGRVTATKGAIPSNGGSTETIQVDANYRRVRILGGYPLASYGAWFALKTSSVAVRTKKPLRNGSRGSMLGCITWVFR